jgi:hypothetical protein
VGLVRISTASQKARVTGGCDRGGVETRSRGVAEYGR